MTTEVNIIIHKLNITEEARFDIRECLEIKQFDWQKMKGEVEEYITYQAKENRIPWWGYFRCKYYDEKSDNMLMLFIYKSKKLSIMQHWDLAGVCLAEDWSEEQECEGCIRSWLKQRIENLPEEDDWAISYRVNTILKETIETEFIEVLQEVRNEFECKRDKETAEEMAFLQSYYYDFTGRRACKKTKRN